MTDHGLEIAREWMDTSSLMWRELTPDGPRLCGGERKRRGKGTGRTPGRPTWPGRAEWWPDAHEPGRECELGRTRCRAWDESPAGYPRPRGRRDYGHLRAGRPRLGHPHWVTGREGVRAIRTASRESRHTSPSTRERTPEGGGDEARTVTQKEAPSTTQRGGVQEAATADCAAGEEPRWVSAGAACDRPPRRPSCIDTGCSVPRLAGPGRGPWDLPGTAGAPSRSRSRAPGSGLISPIFARNSSKSGNGHGEVQ